MVRPAGAMSCTPPRTICSASPRSLGTGERGRYLVADEIRQCAPGPMRRTTWSWSPRSFDAGRTGTSRPHILGARFQYVFHGSSGSSERELADAISFGAVKVNVDTDNQYAFTRAHGRLRARPLAGGAQGRRRDRGQAQLRSAGVGPGRRGRDGRARPASLPRAARGRPATASFTLGTASVRRFQTRYTHDHIGTSSPNRRVALSMSPRSAGPTLD